jgi:hypothetical protein
MRPAAMSRLTPKEGADKIPNVFALAVRREGFQGTAKDVIL